jgi:hypothetical protein
MTVFTFKPGTRAEEDEWSSAGETITSADKLDAIRRVLEREGPILMEHKFLRGAREPDTRVFSEYGEFVKHLLGHARAGDKISVWSLWPFMRDTPPLAIGKCPDADGAVPKGGAY